MKSYRRYLPEELTFRRMRKACVRSEFGVAYIEDVANNAQKNDDGFTITTEKNGVIEAKHFILATGLGLDLAEKLGVETKAGTEPRIKTVLVANAEGKTNIDGVWAAGTCSGASVHAVITAGDGAKVAINVISEMNGERYVDHDILQPK